MQTMSSIAINAIDLEQAAFIQIANHTGVQIKHKTVILYGLTLYWPLHRTALLKQQQNDTC